MSNRRPRGLGEETLAITDEKKKGLIKGKAEKRKATEEAGVKEREAHRDKLCSLIEVSGEIQTARNSNQEMVPMRDYTPFNEYNDLEFPGLGAASRASNS